MKFQVSLTVAISANNFSFKPLADRDSVENVLEKFSHPNAAAL